MTHINEKIDIIEMYGKDCITDINSFIADKKFNINGLSDYEASQKLAINGLNEISQNKQKRWYSFLFSSLFSPFNTILIGIVFILIYTDIILAIIPNYANIIVILIMIFISTLLDFFEIYSSNKAAEKLKKLVETTCTVIRNGDKQKISLKQIVIGDIVYLSAGDLIPADLKIIEAKDLYVVQSSLTGESEAVKKVAVSSVNNIDNLENISDLNTICFMGTNVTSGTGKAIVFKTADNTYFGKIASTLNSGKPKTSFQKGIESISKLLIRFMFILIPITFLLNNAKHGNLVAFTFSVAIAIGITPLLLPVILSSTLAKGATRMAKKKTIVKKLDSIQSFGAMNILCTDKTGTLTEDKIVLEKYLNVYGEEDINILKDVYLNSFFQTGLKGTIDEAVINRAKAMNLENIYLDYKKIDEIPFDFSRRRLSIAVSNNNKIRLITKGAVEEILNISSFINYKGNILNITDEIKQNIITMTKSLNEDGLRVIAVCEKNNIEYINNFNVSDESNMTLLGFVGFLDPPKESAKTAIERLNNYDIRVIVLTGDNEHITKTICSKVNLNTDRIILGNKLESLSDEAVINLLQTTNVFAKLSPIQKARIIRLLEQTSNIVGYMGDGINDTPSLVNSEVGISVDTAVDIAKETADIILLEKDLNVLTDGVLEGRKTFCNLLKYIKLAASFNFGEVLSVLIASMLLPFFPITPIQLLVQSLLYDMGQLSLTFDNVDSSYLKKSRKWNMQSLKRFMLYMGPTSSIFDLLVFAILWFGFKLKAPDTALFQTIWFSYGVVSNLVGLHIIRTEKLPFLESNASKSVYFSSIFFSVIALVIPFTFIGRFIGLVALPPQFIVLILIIPILYCFVALIVKKLYIKKYNEWI